MLRQCATTAITAVHAASIMFAMAAMLGRLAAQLKMPRLDAYDPTNTRPALQYTLIQIESQRRSA